MFSQKSRWFLVIFLLMSLTLANCQAKNQLPKGLFKTTWQLVVIGDSSLWGLASAYATQIEKDNKVQVEIKDYTLPSLSAISVLRALQTGKSQNMNLSNLANDIKGAEIVVMFANPLDSINPNNPLDLYGCFGCSSPGNCSEGSFSAYIGDLKDIWKEVIRLRDGKPTVLRATDIYNPLISSWNTCDIFDACEDCWIQMSNANRVAAEFFQIPFLSRYDAFNGFDHREDPDKKGFISDGEHTTDQAEEFTAKLLAEMGYTPTNLP